MTKLAPEWVRTSDPVIRSPARYRWTTAPAGVSQGSILVPLLFLIYVNDISNSTSLKLLSFADDTTISCSSPDIDNLYDIVNEELDALNQWFYANKLCLNVKKTKYILVRPSACFPNITNKHLLMINPFPELGTRNKKNPFILDG